MEGERVEPPSAHRLSAATLAPHPAEGGLTQRGINYDIGTDYDPGLSGASRLSTRGYDVRSHVRRDLHVIDEELSCNAVCIYGTDVNLLVESAELALERGLYVWIQPRLIDSSPERRLEHMHAAAMGAERLRREFGPQVGFHVGVELSLFMNGIVPGDAWTDRIPHLFDSAPVPAPTQDRLNRHLRSACRTAKSVFRGPVTYAAGGWEQVDWSVFDVIGLDVYLPLIDDVAYRDYLRGFQQYGKPIVITEFGCNAHQGAELSFGAHIVDWGLNPPQIVGTPVRDERVQAEDIARKLAIFASESLFGAFVFTFIEPVYVHAEDARFDLDMASFGIVAPTRGGPNTRHDFPLHWKGKEAFSRLQEVYRGLARR